MKFINGGGYAGVKDLIILIFSILGLSNDIDVHVSIIIYIKKKVHVHKIENRIQ